MWELPKTAIFSITVAVTTADAWVLTNSWVSCCRGRNAASRMATWSVLSFCHSPIRRITRWVALLSLVNDWHRRSWFSSTASARAITCRNDELRLGTISQFLGPPQITFGALLFFFQTTWWASSPQMQAMLSNERVIIHLLTSFLKKKKMPKVIPNPYGLEIKIPMKSA